MKHLKHSICLVLLCIVTLSAAHAVKRPSSLHVRTVQFYECSFRLTDPFGGRVDDNINAHSGPYVGYSRILKRGTQSDRLDIGFACSTGKPELCQKFKGATHSENGSVEWFTSDEDSLPEEAQVELHALRSGNGSGVVVLYNEMTEDLPNRRRYLSFCLTSPNGAVLSGLSAVDFVDGAHKSVEPEVMQLLRSIEFIDTPEDGVRAAPAATPASTGASMTSGTDATKK